MAGQGSDGTVVVYLSTPAPRAAKTHGYVAKPTPHRSPHVPSRDEQSAPVAQALWFLLIGGLFVWFLAVVLGSRTKREAAERDRVRQLAAQVHLLRNAALTPLTGLGIELQSEESVYWAQAAQWTEMHSERVYEGGSSGASVRVARGLWIHSSGSRGHSRTVLVPGSTSGTAYVTNKRLIFISDATSHEIKLRSWLRIQLYDDGIEMFFDKKTPIQLTTGSEELGIVLDRVLRSDFVAHPETNSDVVPDTALGRRGAEQVLDKN